MGSEDAKNLFELWREYEALAKHFNELLIQVRHWALGSLAGILTVAAAMAKSKEPSRNPCVSRAQRCPEPADSDLWFA